MFCESHKCRLPLSRSVLVAHATGMVGTIKYDVIAVGMQEAVFKVVDDAAAHTQFEPLLSVLSLPPLLPL